MPLYENNQFSLMYDNDGIKFAIFMGRDLEKQLTGLIQRYDEIKLAEISKTIFHEIQKVDIQDKNYELSLALTNYYFERTWGVCQTDISNGKTAIGENKYKYCFDLLLNYEKSSNYKFHKGTPYFFLGYCYLVNGNLDLAFQMIHNGHMENRIAYPKLGREYTEAPSYLFMSLNAKDDRNYLYHYVLIMKEKIDFFIDQHNKLSQKTTTYEIFDNKFLSRTNTIFDDVKFFFVYFIMNLINMNLPGGEVMTDNNFSNIRKLELMFDLCLVIDKTLHEKYKNPYIKEGVGEYLFEKHLTQEKDPKMIIPKLKLNDGTKFEINGDPASVSMHLLSNNVLYRGKSIDYCFGCMLLAWNIRNFSAHNLNGIDEVLKLSYTSIIVRLFSALFFAAEALN